MARKLLAENADELTFDKAVELCVNIEHTAKGAVSLAQAESKEGNRREESVHKLDRVCYRCLGDHSAAVCRHKQATLQVQENRPRRARL